MEKNDEKSAVPVTAEIVKVDDNASTIGDVDVEKAQKSLDALKRFISGQMIASKPGKPGDYGVIPQISTKPSLYKSGAEKLENIFRMSHRFEQLDKIQEWEKTKEFIFYRYRCIVTDKHGRDLGECIGSANSGESRYSNARKNSAGRVGVFDQVNTIDKIAQKRAFVGAILAACRVSSEFTQDIEDMDKPAKKNGPPVLTGVLKCSACQKDVKPNVAEFSANKYQKILCYDCQKKEESSAQNDTSAPVY